MKLFYTVKAAAAGETGQVMVNFIVFVMEPMRGHGDPEKIRRLWKSVTSLH